MATISSGIETRAASVDLKEVVEKVRILSKSTLQDPDHVHITLQASIDAIRVSAGLQSAILLAGNANSANILVVSFDKPHLPSKSVTQIVIFSKETHNTLLDQEYKSIFIVPPTPPPIYV